MARGSLAPPETLAALRKLIIKRGRKWTRLAPELSRITGTTYTGEQCRGMARRLRRADGPAPDPLVRTAWTVERIVLLETLAIEHGPQWRLIAEELSRRPGRELSPKAVQLKARHLGLVQTVAIPCADDPRETRRSRELRERLEHLQRICAVQRAVFDGRTAG